MGLLTDKITTKSEKSNLINAHEPSREPVPPKIALFYSLASAKGNNLFLDKQLVDF